MTILVTGSSGFIGSNLIKYLLHKKKNFIAIDKKQNPYFKLKNFYKFNLNNKKKLEEIILKKKIKKIIHLAAIPGFVNCHKEPKKAFNDNIKATFELLLVCKKYNIKDILLASSKGVDNFLINPSIYGLTKFFCENIAKTFNNNFGMKIKTCKFSNVYGPYSLHKSSAVHIFIKKILNNEKIEIHNNGNQKRDFIFVKDVCKRILSILNSKSKKLQYEITTNKYIKILDLVKALNKITKKRNKLTFVKTPPGYDAKVYKNLNLNMNNDFIKKLELTFNWYKKTINL